MIYLLWFPYRQFPKSLVSVLKNLSLQTILIQLVLRPLVQLVFLVKQRLNLSLLLAFSSPKITTRKYLLYFLKKIDSAIKTMMPSQAVHSLKLMLSALSHCILISNLSWSSPIVPSKVGEEERAWFSEVKIYISKSQ